MRPYISKNSASAKINIDYLDREEKIKGGVAALQQGRLGERCWTNCRIQLDPGLTSFRFNLAMQSLPSSTNCYLILCDTVISED